MKIGNPFAWNRSCRTIESGRGLPHSKTLARGGKRLKNNNGSAVLIVVVLIGCIALLLYANSKTLYLLKEDLKLLNMKQQVKYGQTPVRR